MNCKPGDLAIVIKDASTAKLAGMLVQVLHLAPPTDFLLPDRFVHDGCLPGIWVVKFFHPVTAPIYSRSATRQTEYGCIGDRYLRPLPPPESADAEESTSAEPLEIA